MKLGACYYPEHWPEAVWPDDARRMRAMGLDVIRIGEFAWSRIEPQPGRFDWDWYDRAVETLAGAGLRLVLGTPTATPPKWLVDADPDMLAVDAQGRPRRFGSRRHYCFSSPGYRAESRRITEAVAARFGQHPAVVAWQTDNEYGCHETVLSYSAAAATGFRRWLADRYGNIDALNVAWGTVFWSQEYRDFEEIDPPHLTVTEANPAHRLDYRRFASDEVAAFNREQVDILRRLSPGRDIVHNFMGFFTGFDHHRVGADLDVAAWDSYPLGFLDQGWDAPEVKARFRRQGHPDFAAFHHDLYRGCAGGRMWVLEQQPGPVNWAPNNPAPLPGMVRLWTWEAFAHGAELVSYFRWRQLPFGQEQMHAGLLRPDSVDDVAAEEVRTVAAERELVACGAAVRAQVALVFDYEGLWATEIQPHGKAVHPLRQAFEWYGAVRARGLDIDIVAAGADLSGYRLVLVPFLPILTQSLADALTTSGAVTLLGPRIGSRTPEMHIPQKLPPGPLQSILPLRVVRVETLPPGVTEPLADAPGGVRSWMEQVETDLPPRAATRDGQGVWFARDKLHYLAAEPDPVLLDRIVAELCAEAKLDTCTLPDGLRLRRHGSLRFAFNYDGRAADLSSHVPEAAAFVLGGPVLAPGGVAAWRDPA